nr:hypothetical protein [uncultured bacterium]
MIQKHYPLRSLLLAVICIAAFSLSPVFAADEGKATYNVGDQVEVQWPGDNQWYKAKVTQAKDGRYFIVYDADGNNAWYDPERMRLVKAAELPQNQAQNQTQPPNTTANKPVNSKPGAAPGKTVTAKPKRNADKNGTVLVNRPILIGPIKQPRVKNGARPNPELLKKLIRYRKGEKPAPRGQEGAVTIDISALQIGAPRPWNHLADTGDGLHNVTRVYPVKVTYTEKIWYYTRVEVYENSIRIINFHVDKFGEWKIGSEEIVKSPTVKSVPRP